LLPRAHYHQKAVKTFARQYQAATYSNGQQSLSFSYKKILPTPKMKHQ
jgi:hypothetical protein